MKRFLLVSTLALTFAGCQSDAIVDAGPRDALLYEAREVTWQSGPASFEAGSQMAILEGDPSEPGLFTMRFRLPDGFVINPHWHPNVERVTVLSGTFRLGHGERFDPADTEALRAGSYFSMPPGMRHYAIAEGDTVIQLTSIGPWEINYVRDEDDPRLR